ncbi:MAG TPA: hypothetical protein VMG60_24575 [Burkholderiaceae bacterium]|nr:hypothetical protein [Burkholderiaceae bacterium]
MSRNAQLIVIERIAPARHTPMGRDQATARSDLNVPVNLSGRGCTRAEFEALPRPSGFRNSRIVETASDYSVIEALPR